VSVWLHALAVDPQGNAYVTGSTEVYPLSGGLVEGVFVTKFSPTGAARFTRVFQGNDFDAAAADLAIAPNGDVLVAGYYSGTLDFGIASLTSRARSGSSSTCNGFVAALDPADGTARWARSFGGTTFDLAYAIDVTPSGALRVSGELSGASEIGGLSATAAIDGAPFVAELTADGVGQWVRVVEPSGLVFASDTDPAGRTYAVGRVPGASSGYPMNGSRSFVAAVLGDGSFSLPLDVVTNAGGALGVATDRQGGLWVVGTFAGSVAFGGVTLSGPTTSNGAQYLLYLAP
jgi:hypothetical protein